MTSLCRSCSNSNLASIVDLGLQFLSDFRVEKSLPEKFPLNLVFCLSCFLVQLEFSTPRDLMYHDGYGYKSGVNEKLKQNLESLVNKSLNFNPNTKNWLDVASNDGTLLSYVPKKIYRIGIDPVPKFKQEAINYANEVIIDYFPPNKKLKTKFDIVTASFMFYDLENPKLFLEEVRDVLTKNGILVIQQNYLLEMLKNNAYDNISHEHLTYFSLSSMLSLVNSTGLEIFHVETNDINGGSFITFISEKGNYEVDSSVEKLLKTEETYGLKEIESYQKFAKCIDQLSSKLQHLVQDLVRNGKSIYIYGASTRGSTIWQHSRVGAKEIHFAVERQIEKVGKYFSAIQVPIISEMDMREQKPDYLLIGPWFLKDVFLVREQEYLRNGGKFIVPLPEVEIISSTNSYKINGAPEGI